MHKVYMGIVNIVGVQWAADMKFGRNWYNIWEKLLRVRASNITVGKLDV